MNEPASSPRESKACFSANAEDGPFAEHDPGAGAERTDIEYFSAAELRAIAPEELQLLAATGC